MLRISRGICGAVAVLTLAVFSVPARAAIPAGPGVINYIEGTASVDGRPVTSKDIGRAELRQNQVLATGQGKAEMLLTPGVLLRMGANSELRMVSPNLTDTRVDLLRGNAMIEATDVHKENNIRVLDHGVTTTLVKNGLYDFDADSPRVSVYDGKALVQGNDNTVKAGKGKQVVLAGHLKAVSFDRNQRDDLYAWSSLRSQYLSQASINTVRGYAGNPYAYGWYGPGWYWDPYSSFYSFIPGAGFLYSPFGYGFYSPFAIYAAPGFYGHGLVTGVSPARGVFRGGVPVTPLSRSSGFRSSGGFSGARGGFRR